MTAYFLFPLQVQHAMILFHECTKATLEIVATLSLTYSTLPMNFTRPDLYNNFRRSRWKAATAQHRRRRTLIRLQNQPRKQNTDDQCNSS